MITYDRCLEAITSEIVVPDSHDTEVQRYVSIMSRSPNTHCLIALLSYFYRPCTYCLMQLSPSSTSFSMSVLNGNGRPVPVAAISHSSDRRLALLVYWLLCVFIIIIHSQA